MNETQNAKMNEKVNYAIKNRQLSQKSIMYVYSLCV